jgi:hypothetical protein
MQSRTIVAGPLATADPNGICESQTPTAGALDLDGILVSGGVAELGSLRRVLITTADDESSNTFTITGTNWSGQIISETIVGPDATTGQSVLDYLTVTSVTISGNAAGAVEVGTSGVGGSPWFRTDDFAPSSISVQCNVTGTANYTLQSTLDDPNDPVYPVAIDDVSWVNSSDTTVVASSVTQQSNFLFAPKFIRVVLNSGTGSVATTILQSSNGPR